MSGLSNLSEKEKKEFAEEFEEFLEDFEEMLKPEEAFVFSCEQLGVSEAEGRELLGLVERKK